MRVPRKPVMAAAILALLAAFLLSGEVAGNAACDPMGWAPAGLDIKDHTAFTYGGMTYIAAIQLPEETQFAYARSADLCSWESLAPILSERTPGDWDENRIWAPFVYEESGIYYLFYTGVNDSYAQSIMLATSTDPSDPASWTEQGMVFQPSHSGAIWSPNSWSNNRDPMLVARTGVYYLFYTGKDSGGGIVGLAAAPSPAGPWSDLGPSLGPVPGRILESPAVFSAWGAEYLIYHLTSPGQSYGAVYRSSTSLSGPWSQPRPMLPGWAHEVWPDPAGDMHVSYLTGYSITIDILNWDPAFIPPRPFIGIYLTDILLPLIRLDP